MDKDIGRTDDHPTNQPEPRAERCKVSCETARGGQGEEADMDAIRREIETVGISNVVESGEGNGEEEVERDAWDGISRNAYGVGRTGGGLE